MRILSNVAVSLAWCLVSADAASIQFAQSGWSTGATLNVTFTGQDANTDGVLTQSELITFSAFWSPFLGDAISWMLSDIQPEGFFFDDFDNYLVFTRNARFSFVSSAFDGEALASVFDSYLFPIDSTDASPTVVPEPSGLSLIGIAVLGLWQCYRLRAFGRRKKA